MRHKSGLLGLLLPLLMAVSCNTEEGPGGNSTITGKVKVIEYNEDFSQITGTYYAGAEDVFLVYGDDAIYSDDFKTGPDGSFKFDYLRKGDYTVFVYSDDSTGTLAGGKTVVSVSLNIADNGSLVDAGEIIILKSKRANGTCSIGGKVWCRNYNSDFTALLGAYYTPDEDVFLVRAGDSYYCDDVKTDINGNYRFDEVLPGDYTVYAWSKDSTMTIPSGYFQVSKNVTVTETPEQHYVLSDFVILN